MTLTTPDVLDALDRRYSQNASGTKGEQWVTIREARSGAGFSGNNGQCDYLAVNTWQSKGLQIIGHEAKVSRSDWRRELEHPEKSDQFARFCRRWWVVAPSELARKIKPELPPAWGLMSVSDKGRITETVAAPAKEPAAVPVWWWVGWLAQLDRAAKRETRSEVDRLVNEGITKAQERWERQRPDRTEQLRQRYADLDERLTALHDATGIDMRHAGQWQLDRLGGLWKLAQTTDLDRLASTLRATAEQMTAVAEDH